MNIVFLDYKSLGEDLDLSKFSALGNVEIYNLLSTESADEYIGEAEVIIINKYPINEKTVGAAKKLKLVCVTATGTNNLDKDYLASRGIEWRNVAGYSTECVTQHTFALLFYLLEKLSYYDGYVKSGKYMADKSFSHFFETFHELCGKTWGIIGMGAIGQNVARIAESFGCKVKYYSTSGKNTEQPYENLSFEDLLKISDIVSVHAPLNEDTEGLMDERAFSLMKPSSIFINVGRGPIVKEEALANALKTGQIMSAGLDVLSVEPMAKDNPLYEIQDSKRLIITPHIAWAAVETRQRLVDIIYNQVKEYIG